MILGKTAGRQGLSHLGCEYSSTRKGKEGALRNSHTLPMLSTHGEGRAVSVSLFRESVTKYNTSK